MIAIAVEHDAAEALVESVLQVSRLAVGVLAVCGECFAEVKKYSMVARLPQRPVESPEDALLSGRTLLLDVAMPHDERDEPRELLLLLLQQRESDPTGDASSSGLGRASGLNDGAAVRNAGDHSVEFEQLD